jgi:hypothetical protein
VTTNINSGHAKGRRATKKGIVTKPPKVAPVIVKWVHPAAIQEAKNLAFGRDVHVDYDTDEGCMWIRNGAK